MGTTPNDMTDAAAILKQVEDYFSDANLKRDHFFQKEISKDTQGFISMDLLLRCNKLKQLTQDPAAVVAAIAASETVEVSEDKTKIRKVGAVPTLDEDVAARAKARNTTSLEDMTAMIAKVAEDAAKDRVVYKLTGLPAGCRWMDIKDALKEVMETTGRMHVSHEDGQTECHITAMKEGNSEAWATAATLGDKLKVQDTVIAMTAVSDEAEALVFWTAEFTKNPPESVKKAKTAPKKESANKNKRKASTTINVCGTEYDYSALKNRVTEISKAHTDDLTALDGEEKTFIEAVLEFHPRAAEKKTDMTGVAVGVNKEFPDTRCFFVVKAAGNEDFSYKKCVDTAFGMDAKKGKTE